MLPILFQNKDLILYSYPLLMGLGWGVAYQIFFALLPADFPRRYGQILFWGVFLCAWIGAKLLFLLTLPEGEGIDLIRQSSFWMGGGFVFYGGLISGALFVACYRVCGLPLNLKSFWAIVPALTLGHGVGRLGCFLAGCCFGQETTWWWGVFMHQAYRHPTQLIEACSLLALGIYLLRSRREIPLLAGRYLLFYGLIRLIVEALRGDIVRGMWGPLTPSQWISGLFILLGVLQETRKINILQLFKVK